MSYFPGDDQFVNPQGGEKGKQAPDPQQSDVGRPEPTKETAGGMPDQPGDIR
jgi:hypothetical protein